MTHSISQVGDKARVILTKVAFLEENRDIDKHTKQFMLDDIRALARDIERGLVDLNK